MCWPVFALCSIVCALPAPLTSATPDVKSLLVYGDKWSFFVKEPDAWHGDITAAHQLGVNIVFYKDTETWKTSTTLIWIQVMPRDGPHVADDLASDMSRYKAKDSQISFESLSAPNPTYPSFAKVYLETGHPASYVAYLDVTNAPFYFSVTMQPVKGRATDDELAAFRSITASIVFGPATIIIPTPQPTTPS